MRAKHVGLIANTGKPGAVELVAKLCEEFAQHAVRLSLEKESAERANLPDGRSIKTLARECDLLLVLGGDGTMLQVVQGFTGPIPPVFGINSGTLGFLTCIASGGHKEAVDHIVNGTYELSKRTLLNVEVLRDGEPVTTHRALNDAVLSRGEQSRLIRLAVRISGALLTEYNADGLIVATPTGSTAYSLSAGGPVLTPDSGVFVLTPICPHVLTNRSVIVSDENTIVIEPSRNQGVDFLTLDGGTVERIESTDSIRITKSPFQLPLAMPPDVSFFDVLRQKLKWSGTAV